jgi:hypothetical protein
VLLCFGLALNYIMCFAVFLASSSAFSLAYAGFMEGACDGPECKSFSYDGFRRVPFSITLCLQLVLGTM